MLKANKFGWFLQFFTICAVAFSISLCDDDFHLLSVAIGRDNVASVEQFFELRYQNDVDRMRNATGWSALHLAALYGAEKVAEFLILKGANITEANQHGETPLHLACLGNHENLVDLLIKAASEQPVQLQTTTAAIFNVSEYLKNANSPSEILEELASLRDFVNVAESLAKTDQNGRLTAMLEVQQFEGKTPIFYAVKATSSIVVKLVSLGANTLHRDHDGLLPIHFAVVDKHLEAIDILFKQNSSLAQAATGDNSSKTVSHLAAEHNYVQLFDSADHEHFNPNDLDGKGQTAACWAAINGSYEFAQEMLKRSHPIAVGNCVIDGEGRIGSPLHVAAYYRHKNYVDMLLNNEANAMARDSANGTVLHAMALRDSLDANADKDIVAMLIAKHEPTIIEAKDGTGKTPFLSAAELGSVAFASILRDAFSAKVEAVDNNGYTALHLTGDASFVDELLALDKIDFGIESRTPGQDGSRKNQFGNLTVLLAATKLKQPIAFLRHLLVDLKADPSTVSDFGQNAIAIAVEVNYVEALEFFAEHLLDFSAKDSLNRTPLLLAIELGKTEAAVKLNDLVPGRSILPEPNSMNTPLHLAAQRGNLEVIRHLVNNSHVRLAALNAKNQTALHLAVIFQRVDCVLELVLQTGGASSIVIRDYNGRTPLHLAATRCSAVGAQITDTLVSYLALADIPASILETEDLYGLTPFDLAVQHNCHEIVEILLKAFGDDSKQKERCRKPNKHGLTLVQDAMSKGHESLTAAIVQNGTCALNERGAACERPCGDLPIIANGEVSNGNFCANSQRVLSCHDGFPLMGSYIVECGPNGRWIVRGYCYEKKCPALPELTNGKFSDGSNVVGSVRYASCNEGYGLVANRTVVCDVSGNWQVSASCQRVEFKGEIFAAAEQGDTKMLKWLIEQEAADVNAKRAATKGATALMIAALYKRTESVKLLLDYGANVADEDTSGWSALEYATRHKHTDGVRLLLEHGGVLVNADLSAILNEAVMANHSAAVPLLVQYGADVNDKDRYEWTPLMYASAYSDAETVRVLLENGANLNEKDSQGWTPLTAAARYNHAEVVQMLLEHGAKVNERKEDGWSALMYASVYGETEAVRLLLQHGANANSQKDDGLNALMLATWYNQTETVRLLVDKGADVNQKNNTGWTALMFAARFYHTEALRLLLQHSASVNDKESGGLSALLMAVRYYHTEAVRLLLENDAFPHSKDSLGKTALMYAAMYNHTEAVRLLLDNEADVNERNVLGETALLMAAESGHFEVCQLLIDKKANVNARAVYGISPIQVAKDNEYEDIVELLKKNGAEE